jgi:hypothetical protein
MTHKEFLTAFMPMQKYYGKILEKEVMGIYWSRLQSFPNKVFLNMVSNLMDNYRPTSQNPFPLIANFLSSVGLSGENRAQAAVTAVKNAVEKLGAWSSVDFDDPALHAVINRFGGWPEVCSWGNSGQWKFMETKFMEAYDAAVSCGESAGPLEGNFAIGNRDKNQSTWNERMKICYNESIKPKKIEWINAGFSHQIENKGQKQKRISGNPEKLSEVL